MKCFILMVACAMCAVSLAVPVPSQEELSIVQIPMAGNKEIDILSLASEDSQLNERNKRTIGILRELFPELSKVAADGPNADAVDIAALSQKLESISRVVRQTQAAEAAAVAGAPAQVADDANKSPALDELSLDSEDSEDNRNKRFLNFGFGGSSTGNSAGGASSGGSGNFLFDIIRRTADRAARAAGTVYRVVAGTESLGIAGVAKAQSTTMTTQTNTLTMTTSTQNQQLQQPLDSLDDQRASSDDQTARTYTSLGPSFGLVSGSSGTEQADAAENAPEADAGKSTDGYTEGIPGPVTRLFVLANRGLANLIQDLILRLAATSERVVNFKARLITSLI